MKTNYYDLTKFEAAMIAMVILGAAIIGIEFYISMPANMQTNVAQAFEIFDLSEPVAEQSAQIAILFEGVNEVYEQFYIAFDQTLAIPDQIAFINSTTTVAFDETLVFADEIIASIFPPQPTNLASGPSGEVLGATTEINLSELKQEEAYVLQAVNGFKYLINQFGY